MIVGGHDDSQRVVLNVVLMAITCRVQSAALQSITRHSMLTESWVWILCEEVVGIYLGWKRCVLKGVLGLAFWFM